MVKNKQYDVLLIFDYLNLNSWLTTESYLPQYSLLPLTIF